MRFRDKSPHTVFKALVNTQVYSPIKKYVICRTVTFTVDIKYILTIRENILRYFYCSAIQYFITAIIKVQLYLLCFRTSLYKYFLNNM